MFLLFLAKFGNILILSYITKSLIINITQRPPQNIPRKTTSSCTDLLQASSKMQNVIVGSSPGTKNVCFSASSRPPREYPESMFPRKISGRS